MSEYIPKAVRVAVGKRANDCCEYCYSQERVATQSFSIDHIYPYSLGGRNNLDNLALACPGCNGYKSNKIEGVDPVTQVHISLYHPRNHRWSGHFVWSENYSVIIGLTPIGRATVTTLRLNRDALVNLRNILYSMGEHPPT